MRIITSGSRSSSLSDDGDQRALIVPEAEESAAVEEGSLEGREASVLSSGKSPDELARAAQNAEHDRHQKFKGHFERISIGFLYLLAGGMLAVGIVWTWHLVSPDCWQWLDHEQLDTLKDLLTGGLIVGVLTDHFRKRLS